MLEVVPTTSYVKRRAGAVTSASLMWDRSYIYQRTTRGKTAAQNAGLRFEYKVCESLVDSYEGFMPQIVFRFTSDYVTERCICDGVFFWGAKGDEIVLVEVKSRHTADAWFSLRYLYGPVATKAFPGKRIRLLEICKHYDLSVRLPDVTKLYKSVDEFLRSNDGFGVVCWRG